MIKQYFEDHEVLVGLLKKGTIWNIQEYPMSLPRKFIIIRYRQTELAGQSFHFRKHLRMKYGIILNILERLGGGGHMTSAGAQLPDVSIEEATEMIKGAVLDYIKEVSEK